MSEPREMTMVNAANWITSNIKKNLPKKIKTSIKLKRKQLRNALEDPRHPSIDLWFPINEKPRYGYGQPPHNQLYKIISQERSNYENYLNKFLDYRNDLIQIPKGKWGLKELPGQANEPFWMNKMLPGLDAVTLYGMLCIHNPKRYFEIGSGNSTKFARKAIKNHNLRTEIVSFDPYPRAEVDSICDRLIREGIENLDLSIFDELEAGDILFIDGSHYLFMNSDVTVVFLDILPTLKPGVLVEFHDIFLPYDYPPETINNHYSEQYMLAAYLLAGSDKFKVIFPCAYVSKDDQLRQILIDNLWQIPKMDDGINIIKPWINWLWEGMSFWLEIIKQV